ncbi:MAG: preprotein translocase subunit YajC [Sphaerospermopsis sp. SIO1G2]|nr:preprotein translocase subunit YajC [Sphaerospermopsis sp. SIO1G2]
MVFSNVYAQTATDTMAAESSPVASFVPLLLIMVIFYFLILRPQQKKYKNHQAMVMAVKKGDKVQTSGGVIGKVTKVDETANLVHVSIADDVTVEVSRPTLAHVFEKDSPKKSATANK